jgi:hypothetical protein
VSSACHILPDEAEFEEQNNWQSGKVAKWQSGKMAKWQNGKVAKLCNRMRFPKFPYFTISPFRYFDMTEPREAITR